MEFHQITLADKEEYEKYYKAEYRMGSEASFTTPYIWGKSYKTFVYSENDIMCIRGENKQGIPYYMMPVGFGNLEKFLRQLYDVCHEMKIPFSLHWLRKEDVSIIEKLFSEKMIVTDSRNSAEYIYETEALLTLAGKKLHAKRNHVNAFKSTYTYRTEAITKDNIAKAKEFVISHCNTEDEIHAMQLLFASYFTLHITGMLLYADDTLAAVTAGEQINSDTALIHLEKADTSFTGAYPAVNQLFVQEYFAHTKYINREEDMGIEGLRKAKLSYRPAFLLKKFTVTEAI